MLHLVDMTSVFSSGTLTQIAISCVLRFLGGVRGLIFLLHLTVNFPFITAVEMDSVPSELHYRGDDQGTLAVVADG